MDGSQDRFAAFQSADDQLRLTTIAKDFANATRERLAPIAGRYLESGNPI